jgi:hypothetical protein
MLEKMLRYYIKLLSIVEVLIFGTFTDLLFKSGSLNDGIVQLCVGIANLLLATEEFEPLGQAGDGAMPLSQWGHDLRVLHDEGWIDASFLQEFADQLWNKNIKFSK